MKTREEILEITKDIVSFGVFDEDVDAFLKYIRPLPSGSVVVEFGTGRTKNVTRIALSNPEAIVFTFDNAQEDMDLGVAGYVKEVISRMRSRGLDNVYFTLGDSRTVYPDWDLPVDVINIDSSHQYDPTVEELAVWIPRVKQGGIIMLHDYMFQDPRVEGLQRAANEYFTKDKFEWLETLGMTTVIRKL